MSPTSWLQQISPNGLQRTKQNPDVFQVILMDLTPANTDDDPMLVPRLSDLSKAQRNLVSSITSHAEIVVNRWSMMDIELLEDLVAYEPELFSQLKQQLFSVVEDERMCAYLDLGRAWFPVRLLFQYGTRMEASDAVSLVEGKKRVNIFSGKPVYPDDSFVDTRYQEPDEVAKIAHSLSEFDDAEFRCRFEYAVRERPSAYGNVVLEEQYYGLTLEYCQAIQKFYTDANRQGFGVINVLS